MTQPLRSPKDEGDHNKPHPNRDVRLQDLLDLEKRLPSKEDFSVIRDLLQKILDRLINRRVRFDWIVGPVEEKIQKEEETMIIKLTNEQQVTVTLSPKTDGGRPAKLDGAPTWSVVSGESTVIPSEDGLSALIVSSDNPGDTQILVKADADLGDGVEEISEILEVQIAGASAKNLGITVGTPEVKPPTP